MLNWSNKFVKEGLAFDDILLILTESRILPNDVDLKVELTSSLKLNLPSISARMDAVTECEMAAVMAQADDLGVIHKNMTITNQVSGVKLVRNTEVTSEEVAVDNKHYLLVAAAVGVTTDTFEHANALVDAGANAIIIDTAHGHSANVLRKISEVRAKFPNINLIAGSIATATGTHALYDVGIDVVKVGTGPGSICTIRIATRVGVPQITAIYDAANVAREYGKIIIVDGGIKYSGGIVEALVAGGNAVMLGSMFSGIHETPGQIFENQGRKFKAYRDVGSVGVMSQAHGLSDCYLQGGVNEANKLAPEGVEVCITYKGHVKDVILQLVGGPYVGMGCVGVPDLTASIENAQFVRVTSAGLVESHPHDAQITEQAPNYQE